MNNKVIKEKISYYKELLKLFVYALIASFAGTEALILKAYEHKDNFYIFLSAMGTVLTLILLFVSKTSWNIIRKEANKLA